MAWPWPKDSWSLRPPQKEWTMLANYIHAITTLRQSNMAIDDHVPLTFKHHRHLEQLDEPLCGSLGVSMESGGFDPWGVYRCGFLSHGGSPSYHGFQYVSILSHGPITWIGGTSILGNLHKNQIDDALRVWTKKRGDSTNLWIPYPRERCCERGKSVVMKYLYCFKMLNSNVTRVHFPRRTSMSGFIDWQDLRTNWTFMSEDLILEAYDVSFATFPRGQSCIPSKNFTSSWWGILVHNIYSTHSAIVYTLL